MYPNQLPYSLSPINQKGMTLIEVLVASTILFSFLAVMTQVMATASIASDQAEKNVTISLNMPFIIDQVTIDINKGRMSSTNAYFTPEISYQWRAQSKERKEIRRSTLQSGKIRYVTLYNVELSIGYKGLKKVFYYTELLSE